MIALTHASTFRHSCTGAVEVLYYVVGLACGLRHGDINTNCGDLTKLYHRAL